MSTKREATYEMAMAAGWDAGNRNMKRAGRGSWNEEDHDEAARITERLMGSPEKAAEKMVCAVRMWPTDANGSPV